MKSISVLILLSTLLVISCGEQKSTNIKDDIIGKWNSTDKMLTLEFTKDGKINSVRDQGNFINETTADLIFIDETHIVGVWEFNLATWEVNIYGSKMTLKRDDGEKIKLNKINE